MYKSNQQRYKFPIPTSTPRIHPTRLVRVPPQLENDTTYDTEHHWNVHLENEDIEKQSARHLMQISRMHKAIHIASSVTPHHEQQKLMEEEWWPAGIQQTGPLPILNIYGDRPFGYTEPISVTIDPPIQGPTTIHHHMPLLSWLRHPVFKLLIGTLIGLALLALVARSVDLATVMDTLKKNLTTPRGIGLALLSGLVFLLAFSIRGVRWQLFLRPIGDIQIHKAIQLYLIGTFLNFALPIRGGEVSKCIMLRRISAIPISQSLPTVAMDKALDLMPAIFIIALVPILGIHMDIKLWSVMATVGILVLAMVVFVLLAIWKRTSTIEFIQRITRLLPAAVGNKLEDMATGFVDALLAGASQPGIFIPAIFLTLLAIICDGLFAMLAFWTVGHRFPL
ncbi:lysylphosphatidylglycerol synthase transmembrane domain-containing protein [Dictyobacter kobayashii]|uniref:Flippase-like domain-containing protein n=1 Tax=Dictyobacter kobayashii TaxID=2014872 RepID=A0A402AFX3_9CHLR|nr:lysylphosphatidylglycerol synthase transmembrane domain-containing protein [Dictyobacter kobayashii]GCE18011.1 hypothetical protein KDK_18110 [Dictyobacter kobayashii]